PWQELPEEVRQVILYGSDGEEITFQYRAKSGREFEYTKEYQGVVPLAERQRDESSQRTETFYDQFFASGPCPACGGSRLCPEARSVRVGGKTIFDIASSTVEEANQFFEQLSFSGSEQLIAQELVKEITARLHFMLQVGVGYLTLDRTAPTLAGGEAERIRLATQIGSGLTGVMYILDEPSIGLHPRDQKRLIDVLCGLRDLGNTVIVVEHDPQTIESADYVVEFGPGAGTAGGSIVHTGTVDSLKADADSITGQYLTGQREVPVPEHRREPDGRRLCIRGASQHNLKNIDIEIPLGLLVCITGVSGSGKSTLINDTLYPLLARQLQGAKRSAGRYQTVEGVELLEKVINIDQSPIGRTPRSNPAT
ncbi:MAG: excinuclease ABC subunit UvrA, partial [Armatimonadetes bacterium]|nr:excinuclease ABC subunit UvrA [Armatimonadota bacterium]